MSAIAAFTRLSGQQRIGGRLVASSGSAAISVWNPATEERVGEIADASALAGTSEGLLPYLAGSLAAVGSILIPQPEPHGA